MVPKATAIKLDAVQRPTPIVALKANVHIKDAPSGRNPLSSAFIPVSLLGGTAAVYSAVLRHPSSTLTPLSMVYLALLALQYALQPRLSKRYISTKTNKQSVALAEEVVKTFMAAAIFTTRPNALEIAQEWTLSTSLAVAGLPAVLYALQGVLQYTAHQYLDPVTFNGLTQTKTLSAALCCYLIMGKPQSPIQIVALILLFGSALLFQEQKKTTTSSGRRDDWFRKGVVPCLGATFLSGLAGALSQKGLQMTGGAGGRDAFFYTIEISVFSALTLLLSMAMQSRKRDVSSSTTDAASWHSHWTRKTWIPIVWKAAGGVLTALVHKHAGSVAKGFALMFGLVMSGILQSLLADEEMVPQQTWATLLVMISGWMHFTNPAVVR